MKSVIKISVITSVYRGVRYLESFFNNVLEISCLNEVEVVLIHNDPTEEEKTIIDKFIKTIPNFIYKVVERESIYTSWNRAIKLSSGKYIAMWSVDDRRTSDSLRQQANLLDSNPDCMIVSGDYYKVFRYGDTQGYLKKAPIKKSIINNIPKFNNGCFLMWRSSIHKDIGYFDEQFKIAGDWEFWARVASKYHAMSYNGILGYYLRIDNEGLSKIKSKVINIENQIIHLRYYTFIIIDIYALFNRNDVKLSYMVNFKKKEKLSISTKYIYLKCIPSIFLFWVPKLKKYIVSLLYKKRMDMILTK